jgi:hypothetical protein
MTTNGGLNHPDRVMGHCPEPGDLMTPDMDFNHPEQSDVIALDRVI